MQNKVQKAVTSPHASELSNAEIETVFSHKRYFINNVDSYHGRYILKQVSKIVDTLNVPAPPLIAIAVAEDMEPEPPAPPELPYEIYATVNDPKFKKIDQISYIIPKPEVLPQMLTCGTVILDISYDREELRIAMNYMKLLKDLLEKEKVNMDSKSARSAIDNADAGAGETAKRNLILISSVMTWAATKPFDPETPELAFIETDFRKRKSHLNYKLHYDCENEVIGVARNYKSQIKALVVAAGVTYGGGEDVLYYWFQKAWECERLLPIFGRGGNFIPLINVVDLAKIIYNLLNNFPIKLYILAVEQAPTKQREIVKPLGRQFGSGVFKCVPPEDAFLIPDIDQRIFDLMTVDLNMEPSFIVETMGLEWTSDLTFAENVPMLLTQFKNERGLKPFKVMVYGPPIVGKTTLAKLIATNYGVMYVSPETVAQDVADDLSWRIQQYEVGELAGLGILTAEDDDGGGSEAEDTADDETAMEAARTTLALIQSGRPPTEDEIIGYLRRQLLSHEAQNKGWVLDGFPTSLAQCTALFEKGEEEDAVEEEEKDGQPFEEDQNLYANVLRKLLPDVVVSLEASDDFICEKAMRQPEGDTRMSEEVVMRRLVEFRAGDTRDITPLNFFDELDIHPYIVKVTNPADYAMKAPYKEVSLRLGRPSRYPKLQACIDAADKKEREEIELQRTNDEKALQEIERKIREEREDKMEFWSELYASIREEEEASLAVAGEPMRNYLVNHIFPTLTPALLEVAKLRPDDPVDFLAEHLFKQNPSGKMLEPGYNLQAEMMLGKIKILDESLKDLVIQADPLLPPPVEVVDPEAKSKKDLDKMAAL